MARELPKRHTIRMRGYDYAQQGAYYLTICTEHRRHWFGRILDGVMHLSPIGELAQRCWDAIPEHMPHVDIGEFVVMPNHVHGIVIIRERLVDVRGGVADGASDVRGAGTRHDAPKIDGLDAPRINPVDTPDADVDNPVTTPSDPNAPDRDPPNTDMPDAPETHARTGHDPSLPDTPPTDQRAKPPGIPHGALGQIVASYKSAVTRIAYRDVLLSRGTRMWQRNYWDQIIWNQGEWMRIAKYIRDNPANWSKDRFNW